MSTYSDILKELEGLKSTYPQNYTCGRLQVKGQPVSLEELREKVEKMNQDVEAKISKLPNPPPQASTLTLCVNLADQLKANKLSTISAGTCEINTDLPFDLGKIDKKIGELQSEINKLEASTQPVDVSSLQKELDTLETQLGSAETSLKTVKQRIETLEANQSGTNPSTPPPKPEDPGVAITWKSAAIPDISKLKTRSVEIAPSAGGRFQCVWVLEDLTIKGFSFDGNGAGSVASIGQLKTEPKVKDDDKIQLSYATVLATVVKGSDGKDENHIFGLIPVLGTGQNYYAVSRFSSPNFPAAAIAPVYDNKGSFNVPYRYIPAENWKGGERGSYLYPMYLKDAKLPKNCYRENACEAGIAVSEYGNVYSLGSLRSWDFPTYSGINTASHVAFDALSVAVDGRNWGVKTVIMASQIDANTIVIRQFADKLQEWKTGYSEDIPQWQFYHIAKLPKPGNYLIDLCILSAEQKDTDSLIQLAFYEKETRQFFLGWINLGWASSDKWKLDWQKLQASPKGDVIKLRVVPYDSNGKIKPCLAYVDSEGLKYTYL